MSKKGEIDVEATLLIKNPPSRPHHRTSLSHHHPYAWLGFGCGQGVPCHSSSLGCLSVSFCQGSFCQCVLVCRIQNKVPFSSFRHVVQLSTYQHPLHQYLSFVVGSSICALVLLSFYHCSFLDRPFLGCFVQEFAAFFGNCCPTEKPIRTIL